jgi:hypothetical protein
MTSIVTTAITVTTITVTGMRLGADSEQGEVVMTNICCKKLISSKLSEGVTASNSLAPSNHTCSKHHLFCKCTPVICFYSNSISPPQNFV